jgi:uncharacterized protein YyaL (SSP411 family)
MRLTSCVYSIALLSTALFVPACDGPVGSAFSSETGGKNPDQPADTANSPARPKRERAPNRLARETSPYLLLHAHNPVDWHPWGPEAFEVARRENKPIFLSIGYSSCYWCHVMERQVFENEEIAAYMNEHFVNIKVDREERPDVDDLYMLALQIYYQATGSPAGGGWPLSMFLTPAGKPIAGGTYFPPEDRPGMPGFPRVMRQLHDAWINQQEQLTRTSDLLTREVQRLSRPGLSLTEVALDRSLVQSALEAVQASYDSEHGGLDFEADAPHGPKFPVPSRLMLLQSQIAAGDDATARMVDHTLDAMAAGGIRDHLGGGFHRYSTDRFWRVPHFEKMLYDNAQLAEVYVDAFQRTSRQPYRRIAEETFDFVLRELTDPRGGFYSALDAETDGVEGKCYVWTKDEVEAVLGADAARLFGAVYGLDRERNFEHGWVLQLRRPVAEAADELRVPLAELEMQLAEQRARLLKARQARPALLRDDKVLTSWNGLMIRAFARGGQVLQRRDYLAAAEKAALFVLAEMRDAEGGLQRTWRAEQSKLNAYLEDYAFLVSGLLALHDATGDEQWLHAARNLTDDQIERFWDEAGKAFFFTSDHHEELLARAKNAYDGAIPSGNAASVRNLIRLARHTGDERYAEHARATLEVFAPRLRDMPGSLPHMAQALHEYLAFVERTSRSAEPVDPSTSRPEPPAEPLAQRTPPRAGGAAAGEKETLVPFAVATPEEAAKHDKVSARAYLSVDRLPAGGKCSVAIVIDIAEDWHINANPARPDFVIPTELTLTAPQKTKLAEVKYPPGKDFRVAGFDELLSVYEKQTVLRGTLEVPAVAAGKTEEVQLTIRYQACNDKNCLRPMKLTLTGRVPVAKAGETVKPQNAALFPRTPTPARNSP